MTEWQVHQIVGNWLETHGYDGLCNDDGCGCGVDDLYPCGELSGYCIAGHRVATPEGPFTVAGPRPGEVTIENIGDVLRDMRDRLVALECSLDERQADLWVEPPVGPVDDDYVEGERLLRPSGQVGQ